MTQMTDQVLTEFREGFEKELEEGKRPNTAEISMDMYDDLLKVDFGTKRKPKLIGELFGIKIMIDPMLKKDEIKWRFI